jgi:cobalamin biosynthesis protein CobT
MLLKSPLFIGLKHRFVGWRNSAKNRDYRAFTTAFDEIVDASDLPLLLRKQSQKETKSLDEAVRRFEGEFSGERVTIGAAAARLVRDLQSNLEKAEREKSVVSFLIDHSRSMGGLRMLSALLAVDTAVDALVNVGVSTEILGFTTANWKGGRARRAWRWSGQPRNPGRLCDLRHIIYGAADCPSGSPWLLQLALRRDLLHENIDGEALEWAASRLDATRWAHRVICVVSDGAPVDDSTLLANDDADFLARHLEVVECRLRAQGFVVGFLLLGGAHVREPELHEQASEPESAGLSLLALVRRALIPFADGTSDRGA